MVSEEKDDQLIEYLYGELPPFEEASFKDDLNENPELKRNLVNYLQLRQLVQEHLPNKKAPSRLTKKVLVDLGIRRPWYEAWTHGFLRPSLVGAVVLVLTLGIAYQVNRWTRESTLTSERESSQPMKVANAEGELKFSDLLLSNRPLKPSLRPPVRRTLPAFGTPSGGLVSLASIGPSSSLPPPRGIPGEEIHNLEMETKRAVAQFIHKQALRMRALGDFKGAAQNLAQLIKQYPSYPFKMIALTQRIDCLFQAGEMELAKKELAWLESLSPNLALLVGRRWGQ